jgi:putative DNA primase/helicase
MSFASPMIPAALKYAERGLLVFPCKEKIPLTGAGGFKNASSDPVDILKWWNENPDAQIALPTGTINHLFVLDVDGRSGEDALAKLGSIPETFEVQTRPGRRQLWFKQSPGVQTKCSAGVLGPQLDTRGDGGYVVAPPSIHHLTKKPYLVKRDVSWAPVPEFLLHEPARDVPHATDEIPQGHRHHTMLSVAGSMRARGMSPAAILTALRTLNVQQCKPPLPDTELERIAQYTGSKPTGFRGQRPVETCATVELQSYRDVTIEKISWLWPGRLALGKLNLFVGDPEKGKSLVSIDVTARVTTGRPFPDGSKCDPGDVLIVSCEDDASDTVAPRLLHAGADLARVHRLQAVKVTLPDGTVGTSFFSLQRDLEKLEAALEKYPIKLIVIDPLAAFLGSIDAHVDAAVRSVLGPLAEFATKKKIAILGVMHLRKSDASALLRVSGSIGFIAACRIAWAFGPNPDNPQEYVMIAVKNNLGAKGSALPYKIVSSAADTDVGVIEWMHTHVSFTADEILDNSPRRPGRKRDLAEDWLRERLKDGPVPQPIIEHEGIREGFSVKTLRRAKNATGIRTRKASFGNGWLWELPGQGGQDD